MKKLALTLLMAAALFASVEANAASGDVIVAGPGRPEALRVIEPMRNMAMNEDAQDIERYVAEGGVVVADAGCGCAPAPVCGGCCPSECTTCIPQCCPELRGIFDGGLPRGDCSRCHTVSCRKSYWAGNGFNS